MKETAAEWGFAYAADGRGYLPDTMHRYELFNRGVGDFVCRDLLTGWFGEGNFFLFDISFIRDTWWESPRFILKPTTVVLMISPALCLPHLAVIPIHEFVYSNGHFGEGTINFRQEDIRFANLYVVQGQDEEGVRQAINSQVRTQMCRLVNRCCEGKGDQLLFYYPNHRIAPTNLSRFLEQMMGLFNAFTQPQQKEPKGKQSFWRKETI